MGTVAAVEALAAVGERAKLDPSLRGRIHLELARASAAAGQEPARVRADLERARVFLREAGAGGKQELVVWAAEWIAGGVGDEAPVVTPAPESE